MTGRHDDGQTDADWEQLGQHDPYWAVLTFDRFRRAKLDPAGLREFFATGEADVDHGFQTIRAHLEPSFAPRRVLDFGCGVGRLLIPLAKRCQSVVGVDVSESMLREARDNCSSQGIDNVTLVKGDDELSGVQGPFDLVSSFIVFQHIPCRRGSHIFRRLVELVDEGGFGAMHLTYWNKALAAEAATWDAGWPMADGLRHHFAGLRRAARRRLLKLISYRRGREQAANAGALQRNDAAAGPAMPSMQMNPYALNPLFHCLQIAGVRDIHVELIGGQQQRRQRQGLAPGPGGQYGVVVYFRKPPDAG